MCLYDRERDGMPRPVKPPPVILRIEGLSDGRGVQLAADMADDFGEGVIESKVVVEPARKIKDGFTLRDEEWQQRALARAITRADIAEAARELLIRAGRGDLVGYEPEPKLVAPAKQGMRATAVMQTKAGPVAIYVIKPDWRRI
jgi:hypothetical protein